MTADFGIGAQVVVRAASVSDPSPWPGDPSGIIVGAAGSALSGVWGRAEGRVWVVEFDVPQQNPSGRGNVPSAQVHEKYLELAPTVDEQLAPTLDER